MTLVSWLIRRVIFLMSSASSCTEFPELWGEGIDEDILFRAVCSNISLSLCNIWMGGSVFASICGSRKLLGWWLNKAPISEYNRISLRINPFFFFFKISSSRFHPESLYYLVSSYWSPKQCQARLPSHGVGLKSNQILTGYSHKLCATIAYHILQEVQHCRSKDL